MVIANIIVLEAGSVNQPTALYHQHSCPTGEFLTGFHFVLSDHRFVAVIVSSGLSVFVFGG
jgi:hypothetical protein